MRRSPRLATSIVVHILCIAQSVRARVLEVFPPDNAVFNSAEGTITFGAIITPERFDSRYDVDYRVKGSSEEDTVFLKEESSATRSNLYISDLSIFDGVAYEEYIWRIAVKKCRWGWCWDDFTQWRTLIVTSSSNVADTRNTAIVNVNTNDGSRAVYVLHKNSANGPVQFIGTSANPVAAVLPGGTYYLENYDPHPSRSTVQVRVGSSSVYTGRLQQDLQFAVATTSSSPNDNTGGSSFNGLCTENSNRFDICVDLAISKDVSSQGIAAFRQAKTKWESIITGDIVDWPVDTQLRRDLGNEYAGPAFAAGDISNVDDLYIYAKIGPIDGPRGILGQAGPTLAEWDGGTLYAKTGFMEFDEADLGESLKNVILHEMGHVLGLGTLWESNGLYRDPIYRGTNANREYRSVSGRSGSVPIEQGGGAGTADGHFSEACMRHELMTGYLSGTRQPISRITIGALQDLGFQVDYSQADPYTRGDLNLGQCNSRRRGLRTRHLAAGSDGSSHRQLRDDLRVKAIRAGLTSLKKKQEATANIVLPRNVVNLGAHYTEVVIMDDDGEIFLVPVVDGIEDL